MHSLPSKHLFIFLIILSSIGITSYGQDLEGIGKQKPIKVNGSVGTNHSLYSVSGIPNRRPPYMWIVQGNLDFNIYGVSVPVSAFWSNQTREFRQPFNQIGLSPRYKWVTAHLGYRNMFFSSYTLSGHTFLGAGVEATPGIIRLGVMYGRLNKAVSEDTLNHSNEFAAFKRMGMGLKIGVGNKNGDFVDLIAFRGFDDVNSLEYVPIKSNITPAENLVLGINAQKRITKRIVGNIEFARSAYTRDIRAPRYENSNNLFGKTGFLFTPRTSSQYFSAFKTGLTYSGEFYAVQVGYERIEPEFRTMGSYFFNNDLVNYTIAPSIRLLQQRLNLGLNVGIQRNNVNNTNINTTNRLVGSLNIAFIPNEKLNFALQYSNFKNYNKISQRFNQFERLDTLNFYQITENANLSAGYSLSGTERRHSITANVALQRANQTQGETVTNNQSFFYNGILAYRISFVPQNASVSFGLNTNTNNFAQNFSYGYGPIASANKLFFNKKLRTGISSTYNSIVTNDNPSAKAVNVTFTVAYTFFKKHNISFMSTIINRKAKTAYGNEFTEFNGSFGYAYSF